VQIVQKVKLCKNRAALYHSHMLEIIPPNIQALIKEHGSPLYVYSKHYFETRASQLIEQSSPFGLTIRFAAKANPHSQIIGIFNKAGLHFDASSSYEAENLLDQGIPGSHISLSSQQPPHNLEQLLQAGVKFVATSQHQLELYAKAAPRDSKVGLRVNAGMGSGQNNRTTTAGTSASFGLWHEYLDQALEYAKEHHIIIDRLHTHIGSGADPRVWEQAIKTSLAITKRMPDVTSLDMGGGYKIQRVEGEAETDMPSIIDTFNKQLSQFKKDTGRELHLEIEPGTWLVAHGGCLVAEIVDIVDTGKQGYTFLRTNTGLNDFMRPTLYGAQHDMRILNDAATQTEYVVVGHNCESGDILTPEPNDPELIKPRLLNTASIGDLLAIADAGAYCASLRAQGYNAFPSAREIMID
jgi:diaminopimelate decarboxylase